MSLRGSIWMLKLNCFNTISNFILIRWKEARKWSQKILLYADFVTPRQGQGQWKWYKTVEINGAYKHGRHKENLFEKSVCNFQPLMFFSHKMASQHDEQNSLHITHMDQTDTAKRSSSTIVDLHESFSALLDIRALTLVSVTKIFLTSPVCSPSCCSIAFMIPALFPVNGL